MFGLLPINAVKSSERRAPAPTLDQELLSKEVHRQDQRSVADDGGALQVLNGRGQRRSSFLRNYIWSFPATGSFARSKRCSSLRQQACSGGFASVRFLQSGAPLSRRFLNPTQARLSNTSGETNVQSHNQSILFVPFDLLTTAQNRNSLRIEKGSNRKPELEAHNNETNHSSVFQHVTPKDCHCRYHASSPFACQVSRRHGYV